MRSPLGAWVCGLTRLAGSLRGVVRTYIVDPDPRDFNPGIRRCVWLLVWVGGWVRNDPPTPYEKTHNALGVGGLGSGSKKMRVFRGARGDVRVHLSWL